MKNIGKLLTVASIAGLMATAAMPQPAMAMTACVSSPNPYGSDAVEQQSVANDMESINEAMLNNMNMKEELMALLIPNADAGALQNGCDYTTVTVTINAGPPRTFQCHWTQVLPPKPNGTKGVKKDGDSFPVSCTKTPLSFCQGACVILNLLNGYFIPSGINNVAVR